MALTPTGAAARAVVISSGRYRPAVASGDRRITFGFLT
jgi:hypothetical protein